MAMLVDIQDLATGKLPEQEKHLGRYPARNMSAQRPISSTITDDGQGKRKGRRYPLLSLCSFALML